MSKPSMLSFLALVQKRPGMYPGMAAEQPSQRLDALQHLINGYCCAIQVHGIDDAGFAAWAAFPEYLASHFGWSMSQGPIRAIRNASANDTAAWTRFWELLHEFADLPAIDH